MPENSGYVKLKGSWENSAHTIEIKSDGTLVAEIYDFSGMQGGGDSAWGVIVGKEAIPQLVAGLHQEPQLQDQGGDGTADEQLGRLLPLLPNRFHNYSEFKEWLEERKVPFTKFRDAFA